MKIYIGISVLMFFCYLSEVIPKLHGGMCFFVTESSLRLFLFEEYKYLASRVLLYFSRSYNRLSEVWLIS